MAQPNAELKQNRDRLLRIHTRNYDRLQEDDGVLPAEAQARQRNLQRHLNIGNRLARRMANDNQRKKKEMINTTHL